MSSQARGRGRGSTANSSRGVSASASIPTSASIVTSENTSVRENVGKPSDDGYVSRAVEANRIYYAKVGDADDGFLAFRQRIKKKLYLPLDPEFRTIFPSGFQGEVSFAPSSANTEEEVYRVKATVERALMLRAQAEEYRDRWNSSEMDWCTALAGALEYVREYVSKHVRQKEFSIYLNNKWKELDTSFVMPDVLEPRKYLSLPQPDVALGPRFAVTDPVQRALQTWKDSRTPKLDPFVTLDLATPFLVIEVKNADSFKGTMTAKNQLAGAIARAHDILRYLGIQDRLYVLGIVQIGPHTTIYASYSTPKENQVDQILLCDKITIVHVDTFDITTPNGAMMLLKFFEFASEYGRGDFLSAIEAAVIPPTSPVQPGPVSHS